MSKQSHQVRLATKSEEIEVIEYKLYLIEWPKFAVEEHFLIPIDSESVPINKLNEWCRKMGEMSWPDARRDGATCRNLGIIEVWGG